MVKKALAVLAVVVVSAAGLYLMARVFLSVDGGGLIPRFAAARPDYDALETHRARQREVDRSPAAGARSGAGAAAVRHAEVPDPVETVRHPGLGAAGRETAAPPAEAGWPDFRGPARDGRYTGGPVRTDWPAEGLPLLWKQPVGLGYASFTVGAGHAFTLEQRRHEEVVAAYDVETGRELWAVRWNGDFRETMGGDGPRATPVLHDGRVYALGALGELRCLDAETGAGIWRRNILEDSGATNLAWGMSAAPLIVDDKVIVLPGGSGGRSVAAYHRLSGEPVWQALDDRQAYTSPMLVTLAGARQLLVVSATRVVGVTVDEGRLLWEHPWANSTGINVAQPLLVGGNRVFLSSSYGGGATVIEIQRQGEQFSTRTVWENNRMKNRFTSSVLHDGYIYGLDESILACVDAATGELQWKGGRYGYGQLMIAGDRLIVLTESGDLVQVRATPGGHDELVRFKAIEGKTWNHPAIAGGRLLVRNLREMAAFDIRPRQAGG